MAKPLDLTGKRTGRLLIIRCIGSKNRSRIWLCQCDCGQAKEIPADRLSGKCPVKSCGCLQKEGRIPKDVTGQRFGRLLIVKRISEHPSVWLSTCDCGSEKQIPGKHVGCVFSCGCLQKDVVRIEPGRATRNNVLYVYKSNAKRRGFGWFLSEEEFDKLTSSCCHYCGVPPSTLREDKGNYGSYLYNGIDRIENTGDYQISNTVSCCKECNYAKRDMTYDQFVAFLKRAGQFQLNLKRLEAHHGV